MLKMNEKENRRDRSWLQRRSNLTIIVMRQLFKNINGKEISKQYRMSLKESNHEDASVFDSVENINITDEDNCDRQSNKSLSDKSLTFGEIVPDSFLNILKLIQTLEKNIINNNNYSEKVFVDLGSGTGRACFVTALSPFSFTKVVGIEIIPELCEVSNILKEKLITILFDNEKDSCNNNNNHNNNSKKNPKNDALSMKDIKTWISELLLLNKTEVNVTNSSTNRQVSVESLANYICKQVGHKQYKQLIKPHKTFVNLLKTTITNDSFIVLVNNNNVLEITGTLNSSPEYDNNDNSNKNNDNNDNNEDNHNFEDGNENNKSDDIILTIEDQQILKPLPEITFVNKSIFDNEWYIEADVVYAASLLFTENMMIELTQQVLKMKKGSWFISLKELILMENEKLIIQLKSDSFFKMSWQMARVLIYLIN